MTGGGSLVVMQRMMQRAAGRKQSEDKHQQPSHHCHSRPRDGVAQFCLPAHGFGLGQCRASGKMELCEIRCHLKWNVRQDWIGEAGGRRQICHGSFAMHRQTTTKSRRQPPMGLPMVIALAVALAGCGRRESSEPAAEQAKAVRGTPIQPVGTNSVRSVTATNLPVVDWSKPDTMEDGFIRLGYDKLSSFKYDTYEVYSETNSGRALIKSDDVIPPLVKAYDGKRVTVTGFVLPLRTKRGLVTEFLLLRDQGTCCFGAQAQINHFIRVKYPAGFQHGPPVPWKVSGTIRVGEIYIQGYLTGIYQMDAERVVESGARASAP